MQESRREVTLHCRENGAAFSGSERQMSSSSKFCVLKVVGFFCAVFNGVNKANSNISVKLKVGLGAKKSVSSG